MSVTSQLINDLKKKPGRPRSDSTLSAADKQKAYRDRLKLQQQLLPSKDLVYRLQEEIEKLKQFNIMLSRDLQHARSEAEKLQLQLSEIRKPINE